MSLELSRIRDDSALSTEEDGIEQRHIQTLPPTDQGPSAWKFLFGCFLIEAVLWGSALRSSGTDPRINANPSHQVSPLPSVFFKTFIRASPSLRTTPISPSSAHYLPASTSSEPPWPPLLSESIMHGNGRWYGRAVLSVSCLSLAPHSAIPSPLSSPPRVPCTELDSSCCTFLYSAC